MKDKEFNMEKFLTEHHLAAGNYDFEENCRRFIIEMETGLDGESSLEMVPTYIEEAAVIPVGKPVLVLDAGGTNFRAAIITFNEDSFPEITRFRKMGMPGIEKEISAEDFFNCMADFIEDLTEYADCIGFCFSYAMTKTPDRDGRLIKFSKEVKAPEVIGTLIGKELINTLAGRGVDNIKSIVMLNDTVATLLAGKASGPSGGYDDYIGLIIGTGLNASYNEKNSNIRKISDLPAGGRQIINMESGSYDKISSGDIDKAFRDSTDNPDSYHFEKMISGAYLGPLCLDALKKAADDGCFSEEFAEIVIAAAERKGMFGTEDLSILLSDGKFRGDFGIAAGTDDTLRAIELCRAVVNRAAFLAAVKLAGIILKNGRGRTADKPVCICADGSTFWKLTGFREEIERCLGDFLNRRGYYFRFIGIDNAPMIGAAVAGLTN